MLPHKVILLSRVALLLLISSIVPTTAASTTEATTEATTETTKPESTPATMPDTTRQTTTPKPRPSTTTYDYPFTPYEPRDPNKYGKGSNRYGYQDDDQYGDDDDYRVIGRDGQDPREHGQDYADYGPVYGNQESMSGSLNIWIRAADDWEERGRSKYNKNNGGKKYRKGNKDREYNRNDNRDRDYDRKGNKDKEYNDDDDEKDREYGNKGKYDNNNNNNDDYKKGDRKKRSYSRVKFPVRHFKDIRRFPHKSFPPLLSIFPWLPIFYDRITYQTFIFSPTGGIYILPPLINFYGQRFAVAQLIKWGYASLVSSGAPPPPNVNVAPLVAPVPAGGAVAGGVVGGAVGGGVAAAPGPRYDTTKNRFTDGVKTDFPDFKPQYASTFEERGYGNNRGGNRNGYGGGSNYGGTGRQEVYPQGGPRNGGGGGYN